MATNIATLSVQLTAKAGKFISGMRKAGKPVANFAKQIGAASLRVAKYGAATALAAAGGIALIVNQQRKLLDTTAKTSKSLGILPQDLRRLQFSAGLAGVASDSLTKSLAQMERRIGEVAVMGSGEAKRALDVLGLSAKSLIQNSPAEMFLILADRLNTIENVAERGAVAYFLFGRQGQALIPLLAEGSKGLSDQAILFDKLRGVVTALDLAKVEKMNDTLSNATERIKGFKEIVTIAIADKITEMAEGFIEMGNEGALSFDNINAAAKSLADSLPDVQTAFDGIRATTEFIADAWDTMVIGASVVSGILNKAASIGEKVMTFGPKLLSKAIDSQAASELAPAAIFNESVLKPFIAKLDAAGELVGENAAMSFDLTGRATAGIALRGRAADDRLAAKGPQGTPEQIIAAAKKIGESSALARGLSPVIDKEAKRATFREAQFGSGRTEQRIEQVESRIASLRAQDKPFDSPAIQKLIQVLNDLNATLQAQGPNARALGQEL